MHGLSGKGAMEISAKSIERYFLKGQVACEKHIENTKRVRG